MSSGAPFWLLVVVVVSCFVVCLFWRRCPVVSVCASFLGQWSLCQGFCQLSDGLVLSARGSFCQLLTLWCFVVVLFPCWLFLSVILWSDVLSSLSVIYCWLCPSFDCFPVLAHSHWYLFIFHCWWFVLVYLFEEVSIVDVCFDNC